MSSYTAQAVESSHPNSSASPLPGIRLWVAWVLLTLAAGIAGWAFASLAALYTMGLAILVLGATVGLFVGTAQWLAAQRYILRSNHFWDILDGPPLVMVKWPLVSTAGSAAGWIVTAFVYILLVLVGFDVDAATILGFVIGGAVLGTSQWLLLREHFADVSIWIAANIVGCGVGAFVAIWALRMTPETFMEQFPRGAYVMYTREAVEIFIQGAVGMVPFALITGSTLVLIIRRDFFLRSSRTGNSNLIPG